MQINQTIEELIASELRALCSTCAHAPSCIYHLSSAKAIIQCELFELHKGNYEPEGDQPPSGLCANCDHSDYCKLPGRKDGVWRCNEFR